MKEAALIPPRAARTRGSNGALETVSGCLSILLSYFLPETNVDVTIHIEYFVRQKPWHASGTKSAFKYPHDQPLS